ncbi:MAG: class I SAM-dependent methyltransferase [Bdellovibrionota bacterium]
MVTKTEIGDVSDTSLWVATYRAEETERPDALFRDPYARVLAGEKGARIARSMKSSRYVRWSVVIRTHIIDSYIRSLLEEGVDTVLNLGAGLDARPYRMELPGSLQWVEVDFPHLIELKEERLRAEKPHCQLTRVKLDLTDREARRKFFSELNAKSKKVLVLTEGVVPYLSNEQGAELAEDLRAQSHFRFWILDYFSPEVMKYMKRPGKDNQMRNAPFRFLPEDWFGFFGALGWQAREKRFLAEESRKLGRPIPAPWFMKILLLVMPPKSRDRFNHFSAYVVLEPK